MTLLVVFDTETTGTDPSVDEVCQFACVVHSDRWPRTKTLSFETLCNPGRPIDPAAVAVHKITDEMVADKRPAKEVIVEWYAELVDLAIATQEPLVLAGHNTQFDWRFLAKHVEVHSNVLPLCTMRLARRVVPQADNHTLEYLYREFYRLQSPLTATAHDALCDVWMSLELLWHWMDTPLDTGQRPLGSYYDIAHRLQTPAVLPIMPFSKKHKGKPFSQIPRHFLQWLVDQGDEMDVDVRHTAQQWLRGAHG